MSNLHIAPLMTLYIKKVCSIPFIELEALDSPASNKQYSTPVWLVLRISELPYLGDECLLIPDA